MNILTDRERVQKLLEKHEQLRDNDFLLIANLWYRDIQSEGFDPNTYLAKDFFKLFLNKKTVNPQSVIRLRCKLQEEFKHLRGSVWEARHNEETKVVEDLNTIKE